MNPDDGAPFALLERYLAGDASAAEAEAVRAWLAADPEHGRLLDDLRLIRRVAAEAPPESDVEAAWSRAVAELELHGARRQVEASDPLVRSMPHGPAAPIAPRRAHARRRFSWPSLAAAAVVVAVLGGGLLWQVQQRAAAPSEQLTWDEYTTQPGQRANVRLRDGTRLTLAPASRLRVAADFSTTRRDVYLEGEAYFEVANGATPTFRVHTRGSVAEDLGTAFNVRAYAEQTETEVVVTEGRVALWRAETDSVPTASRARAADAEPALVLAAGDLGRLDAGGRASIQRAVDVARYIAWTGGELVFDSTPLGDVVVALERWYDIEVSLTDPDLAAAPLTATFRREPVAQVFERIALTLGVRVERRDESYVLSRAQS